MMKKGKTAGIGAVILAACLLGGCSNALSDGIRALEDGEYEEARDYFQSAVEEDGDKTAEAYRGLGMAYYEMEDYSPALEAFQTAQATSQTHSTRSWALLVFLFSANSMFRPWTLSTPCPLKSSKSILQT